MSAVPARSGPRPPVGLPTRDRQRRWLRAALAVALLPLTVVAGLTVGTAPAMAASYPYPATPATTKLMPGDTVTWSGPSSANVNARVYGASAGGCLGLGDFAPWNEVSGNFTVTVPSDAATRQLRYLRVQIGSEDSRCYGIQWPPYTGSLPTFAYTGTVMAGSTLIWGPTSALPPGATLTYRQLTYVSEAFPSTYDSPDASYTSYTVHPGLVGTAMQVDAVVSVPGFEPALVTIVPKTVIAPAEFGDFTVTPAAATAGVKATASTSTITPTPANKTYSWTVDGVERSTTADFTPALVDVGATATLAVTAKAASTPPPDKTVTRSVTIDNGPGFTGAVKVGKVLTAVDGATPGTFAWNTYADSECTGPSLESATGGTWTVSQSAGGKYVQLTDSSANDGAGATGTCVGPAELATFDSFESSSYTGTPRVDTELTATAPTGLPDDAVVSYSWKVDGNERGASATFTPTDADLEGDLTLTTTVTALGYVDKTLVSAVTKVGYGLFKESAVSISESTPLTPPTKGDTASVTLDETKLPAGYSAAYAWGTLSQGECTPIAGETSTSYTVTNDIAGKKLCLDVSLTRAGYQDAVVTNSFDAVSLGTFTSPEVSFDVAPQVGLESVPVLTGLAPTEDVTYTYVWEVDGVEVATSKAYTPVQADQGKTITVAVTSAKASFVSDTSSATGVKVKKGVFVDMPVPLITGSARVGQTLTRTAVELPALPAGLAVSYSWGLQRVGESDCLAIGSSAITLTLARETRGQKVCVLATYTAPGYATKAFVSSLVGPIDGAELTVWRPVIDDTTPVVGETLTASVSSEGYPADAEVTFTWGAKFTDEKAEEGEDNITCKLGDVTGSTYEVSTADSGRELCVVASVSADGFNPGAAVSRYTSAVPLLQMDELAVSIDDTTPTVGDTLTGTVTGAPDGATLTYAWGVRAVEEGDVPVVICDTTGGATTATLVVSAAMVGAPLCVVVSVEADGYEDATVTSSFTDKVDKATMAGLVVEVSDSTPVFEDELSATLSGAPEGATITWTWGRLAEVDGAESCVVAEGDVASSSSAHTVLADEVGAELCAVAHVSAEGYHDATASAATGEVTGKAFTTASVTGAADPTVGVESTLVGSSVPEADSVAHVWKIAGVEVSSTAAYTPVAADAGKTYAWTVTFSKDGYVKETVSGTGTVAKGTFNAPEVGLDGTPTVGEPVTASADIAGLPEGAEVSWQWFRVGAAGSEDTAIEGATSASHTPVPADAGLGIYATGTFTAPGYQDASGSSAPDTVAKGTFTAPAVTVSPAPKVGQASTASTDLAQAPEGATVSWQWYLLGKDGEEEIEGATGASYTPTADLADQEIVVTGVFTAPGYEDAPASSESASVAKGTLEAPAVTIDDTTPRLGQTLTATSDLSGLPEDASVAYQWGVVAEDVCEPIEEATGATYTVGDDNANVGVRLCVIGTFSAKGYDDATASADTEGTGGGQITQTGQVLLDGKTQLPRPLLGRVLTATLTGSSLPTGAEVAWRFSTARAGFPCTFSGVSVTGASGRYKPTVSGLGRRVCAEATITAPGHDPAVVTNVSGLVTEPARVVLADRTIVRGQRVRVTGYGLTPGKRYTVLAYLRGGVFQVKLTGIAPANGRVSRTFTYPATTPTSRKRHVHIRQPGGYREKDTLIYTR
ncbi:MAG: hypothetical protein NTX33_07410 [Propionibacteriales bacterium]|nr:hypothetical protein [Propionibacteriales bacterium]